MGARIFLKWIWAYTCLIWRGKSYSESWCYTRQQLSRVLQASNGLCYWFLGSVEFCYTKRSEINVLEFFGFNCWLMCLGYSGSPLLRNFVGNIQLAVTELLEQNLCLDSFFSFSQQPHVHILYLGFSCGWLVSVSKQVEDVGGFRGDSRDNGVTLNQCFKEWLIISILLNRGIALCELSMWSLLYGLAC